MGSMGTETMVYAEILPGLPGPPKSPEACWRNPWFSNITILDKIHNSTAREYYLRATTQMGWSRNVLIHQIEAGAYERHRVADKQRNFPRTLSRHFAEQADMALKDEHA